MTIEDLVWEKVCHGGIFPREINEDLKYIYMSFFFYQLRHAHTCSASSQSRITTTPLLIIQVHECQTPYTCSFFRFEDGFVELKRKKDEQISGLFFFFRLFSKTEVGCVGSSEGRSVSRKKLYNFRMLGRAHARGTDGGESDDHGDVLATWTSQ